MLLVIPFVTQSITVERKNNKIIGRLSTIFFRLYPCAGRVRLLSYRTREKEKTILYLSSTDVQTKLILDICYLFVFNDENDSCIGRILMSSLFLSANYAT